MVRVKIKTTNSQDPRRKNTLLTILSNNDVFPTNIFPVQDGFIIVSSDEEQEKIFKDKIKEEFSQEDMNPVIPPELKAKKTVIAFNVNAHIYNNSEDDILNELYTHNSFLEGNIDNVFKFPNSKTIKITFSQAIYASKATEHGLKLFSMKIPHYQIQQDKFYHIQTCFRCYMIESHTTKDCTKHKEYKICSECAEEGHTWKSCNKESKQCINCGENHRTLSMRCKMRKDVIKMKREEEKETASYSQITKTNNIPTMNNSTSTQISREDHFKIYSCMIHAHLMNVVEPGSYEKELNATLKENKLPQIKIPKTPNSSKLLSLLADTEKLSLMETEELLTDTQTDQQQNVITLDTHTQQVSTKQKTQTNTKKQLDSDEIELKIITRESQGWPEDITMGHLIKGIEDGTYKFTYNEPTMESHEVIGLIKKGDIVLKDCFTILEDSVFRKIRTGQCNERSPVARQTQKLKTKNTQ